MTNTAYLVRFKGLWKIINVVLSVFQSAIWQCLNNYDYADAVFLSERLYAEGKLIAVV